MREFTTDDDVKAFLEHVDAWLDEPVTVFLVGGTALTIHGLNTRTEDIVESVEASVTPHAAPLPGVHRG